MNVADALHEIEADANKPPSGGDEASIVATGVEQALAPFPLHCLPPVAENIARAVGRVLRVPGALTGPITLGMLSGAIGTGLEIESGPGRNSRPNLFILTTAASGSGKSEALRWLSSPFRAREHAALEQHRRIILPGASAEIEMLNAEIAACKKKVGKSKGDDVGQRAALMAEMRCLRAELTQAENAVQEPVLTVENVTTEKLAILLSLRGETLFSISGDAGGIVNNLLGRYSKGDRTDETLYLKAWTGEPERVDRVGRSAVRLVRPCLAALWLTQPDKLDELLENTALTDGGLFPRILFNHSGCEPQEMEDAPGVGDRVPTKVEAAWAELIGTLLDCYRLGQRSPIVIAAREDASRMFREHHNASVRRFKSGELRDVNVFRARWTEHGWRIALVLHAATWGEAAPEHALTAGTANAALTITDWFSERQLAALAKGRAERSSKRLESVLTRLHSHGGKVTLRVLEKSHGIEPAEVRVLASAHPEQLGVETIFAGTSGGRPSEVAFLVGVKPT